MTPLHRAAVPLVVPPCHQRKPDPDEPWRYVCPNCGGQVYGRAKHTKYECSSCAVSWYRDELEDLRGST